MAKDYKKIYEEQLLENRMKAAIEELGQHECIRPDGKLYHDFVLTIMVSTNKHAALAYSKVIQAFNVLKKNNVLKNLSPKVKESTLDNVEFFHDYVIRPLESDGKYENIYTGTILKLPTKSGSDFQDGEFWKAALEDKFKIGDQVMYNCRSSIILDHERLHLVSYFVGKMVIDNKNL